MDIVLSFIKNLKLVVIFLKVIKPIKFIFKRIYKYKIHLLMFIVLLIYITQEVLKFTNLFVNYEKGNNVLFDLLLDETSLILFSLFILGYFLLIKLNELIENSKKEIVTSIVNLNEAVYDKFDVKVTEVISSNEKIHNEFSVKIAEIIKPLKDEIHFDVKLTQAIVENISFFYNVTKDEKPIAIKILKNVIDDNLEQELLNLDKPKLVPEELRKTINEYLEQLKDARINCVIANKSYYENGKDYQTNYSLKELIFYFIEQHKIAKFNFMSRVFMLPATINYNKKFSSSYDESCNKAIIIYAITNYLSFIETYILVYNLEETTKLNFSTKIDYVVTSYFRNEMECKLFISSEKDKGKKVLTIEDKFLIRVFKDDFKNKMEIKVSYQDLTKCIKLEKNNLVEIMEILQLKENDIKEVLAFIKEYIEKDARHVFKTENDFNDVKERLNLLTKSFFDKEKK